MSFALKLSKNEHSTSECPALDKELKKEIDAMLSDTGDWKERRLTELFREISEINFSSVSDGLGAQSKNDLIKIKYMGREVELSHSDFKNGPDIWDKLLILMYIKNSGSCNISGKWIAFRDLKDGSIRADAFKEICEKPLAGMFEKNKDEFMNKLTAMGAERASGFSAPHSLVINPLPKIPFLILLWPGEEDFEADCKVLLDSTATFFLDVEALLYLGQALARSVKTW